MKDLKNLYKDIYSKLIGVDNRCNLEKEEIIQEYKDKLLNK